MKAERILRALEGLPSGSRIFGVFSKHQGYCDCNFNQEHVVFYNAWISFCDAGVAIDIETFRVTWLHIIIARSVDGEEIEEPKQVSTEPYKAVEKCVNETHTRYAIKNFLYHAPLPIGEHKVT